MKSVFKHLILFIFGGILYVGIEVIWRGYSHWTMAILGGILFVMIGGINNWFDWEMPFEEQALIGALVVTAAEFMAGCILNIHLGLKIWDYSSMPFNILGQICLPYSLLWVVLSGVAIILDDLLRWVLFDEQAPTYHFAFLEGRD